MIMVPLRGGMLDRRVCPECCAYARDNADVAEDFRPPWQPDARARRQAHLELAGLGRPLAQIIAEFEGSRWDP